MARSKTKKRKSQAPVALVYFVTMIIFFAVIGVFAVFTLRKAGLLRSDDSTAEEVVQSPSFSTLYARVNSKGVLADMTFVRVSPQKQTMTIVPISACTVKSSGSQTFREVYEQYGIVKLKDAVKETFDIDIDYYMSVSNSAFEDITDLFGGISYTPAQELYYLSKDNNNNDISLVKGELVNLSGRQVRLLCQYPIFNDKKQGNNEFLGYAVTQIVNSAFQQAAITKDSLDNLYSIVTEGSETNLKTEDFKTQKVYLKQMLEQNITPAKYYTPKGSWTDDNHFTVDSAYLAELKEILDDGTVSIESQANSKNVETTVLPDADAGTADTQ